MLFEGNNANRTIIKLWPFLTVPVLYSALYQYISPTWLLAEQEAFRCPTTIFQKNIIFKIIKISKSWLKNKRSKKWKEKSFNGFLMFMIIFSCASNSVVQVILPAWTSQSVCLCCCCRGSCALQTFLRRKSYVVICSFWTFLLSFIRFLGFLVVSYLISLFISF